MHRQKQTSQPRNATCGVLCGSPVPNAEKAGTLDNNPPPRHLKSCVDRPLRGGAQQLRYQKQAAREYDRNNTTDFGAAGGSEFTGAYDSSLGWGERGRERERERVRQRQRQTDRQTDTSRNEPKKCFSVFLCLRTGMQKTRYTSPGDMSDVTCPSAKTAA